MYQRERRVEVPPPQWVKLIIRIFYAVDHFSFELILIVNDHETNKTKKKEEETPWINMSRRCFHLLWQIAFQVARRARGRERSEVNAASLCCASQRNPSERTSRQIKRGRTEGLTYGPSWMVGFNFSICVHIKCWLWGALGLILILYAMLSVWNHIPVYDAKHVLGHVIHDSYFLLFIWNVLWKLWTLSFFFGLSNGTQTSFFAISE